MMMRNIVEKKTISLPQNTMVVVVLLMMGGVCGNGGGLSVHHMTMMSASSSSSSSSGSSIGISSRTHNGGGNGGGGSVGWNGFGNGKPDIETHGNVTVLAGQTGQLKCKVTNLANYTVSWIRHKDTHLLTSGADGYTADQRFRAFQGPGNIWGLRISSTKSSDSGVYECQISTTPPIPAFTFLSVVEPVTHIEGLNEKRSELFIKAGSTINLTCVVEDATDNAPKHILWRHNSRMINFEWARGGMSLLTEKKTKGVTVSRLLIQKAMRADSGTYECAPQNAHPAYVKIHVLEQGENQAAMQSSATLLSPITPLVFSTLFFTIFFFVIITSAGGGVSPCDLYNSFMIVFMFIFYCQHNNYSYHSQINQCKCKCIYDDSYKNYNFKISTSSSWLYRPQFIQQQQQQQQQQHVHVHTKCS